MTSFQKITLILSALLIAGWFYWFQYRPTQIRQECSRERAEISEEVKNKAEEDGVSLSREDTLYFTKRLDSKYTVCLHSRGL